jgi:hypothetical protein
MVSKNLIGIIILSVIFTLTIIVQYRFTGRELFTNTNNKSNYDYVPNFSFNTHETTCQYCCKMSENKDPEKCRRNCIVNGNKCLCC